ncbi:polymer-forming cytoskeletal protein [Vibrio lamellibrachiae]|uniref:DUF6701 domain-containing protein n=1 Tax=Vibrio lamellibrachiae TaxID=2910253 RepID=UPI003D0D41D1
MKILFLRTIAMITFGLSFTATAAYFPVDELPKTAAQTWSNSATAELLSSKPILNALNGNQLGYKNNKITNDGDDTDTCSSGDCVGVNSLMIDQPNWSVPNGAQEITIDGSKTLSAGIYDATGEEVKLDGSTLTINGDVTLYVDKMTVQSSGKIVANNGATLVVVARTSETVSLKGNSSFKGHFFSKGFLEIAENVTLIGTVTTNTLKIYDNAQLVGELPDSLPSNSCGVQGNKDFVATMTVTGSSSYQEFYFTNSGGNQRYETLWYTQNPNADPEFIFNEQGLTTGSSYELRFDHDANNDMSYYYRRDAGSSNWEFIEQSNTAIKNGNIVGVGDGVDEFDCVAEDVTPPTYSNDAQYEFGTKQCSSMPCTIDFTKEYDFAPLVFVMPTVDTVDPDLDKPATLVITSALTSDSSSVVINKATVNLSEYPNDIAMTDISYLIIEPGVADFDGHEVIAGYVDTDITKSATHSDGIAIVDYSDFGRQTDFDDPVVLHQIQTRNNGSQWQTSGKVLSNSTKDQQVRLYLELSHTGSGDYESERIAFLATNEEDDLEVQGYEVEFSKGYFKSRQGISGPLEGGCDEFEETDLDSVDGVVAKKQRRPGSDGGWARRCRIDGDKFSVVIDEDSDDRTHVPEEIGYFAFESMELETDLCVYFPEPAQSWEADGEINLLSSNITIEGWSESYEDAYLSDNDLIIAFEETDNNENESRLVDSCITSTGTVNCVLKTGATPPLADTPIDLSPTWGTRVLTVDNWNFETVCSSLSECETSTVDGQRVLTIKESLKELTVSASGQSIKTVFESTSGSYGISIEEYISDGAVLNYFQANSSYTFGEFNYSGSGSSLSSETGVVINIEDSYSQSNAVPFYDVDGTRDLIFYGPDADLTFRTQDGNDIIAQILADEVEFTNLSIIRGAITSNNLVFHVAGSKIIGEGACLTPPPSSTYEIVLTPSVDIALTCDDIPLTATVYKDDVVHTSYSGDITLSVNGSNLETKTASSGVAEFDLTYEQVSNVTAMVSTEIDSVTYDDSGSYEFVPYLYELSADPLQVIAGKSQTFEIRPMECSSEGSAISSPNYVGAKTLKLSSVSYVTPSTPINSAAISLFDKGINDWVDTPASGTVNFTADFSLMNSEVVASSELIYPEAGEVSYTLTGEQCIDDENGDPICKTFSGKQTVQARPWTFAICSEDDVSGNSSGGVGYQAAGTAFSTMVKPIVWQTNGSTTDDIDTSTYCGATVTQNFFVSDAPSAIIVMTNELDTPNAGNNGTLSGLPDPGVNHDSNSTGRDYYDFANLNWDEVGSIRLLVDTQATYLGMDINQGYRNIGRFYPAHLVLYSNAWSYVNNHDGFAYMNQPIAHSIVVEARNSTDCEAGDCTTDNYGLFDEDYIVGVKFLAVNGSSKELEDRVENYVTMLWEGSHWSGAQLNITQNDFTFIKQLVPNSDSVMLTTEDGPFVSGFGLRVYDKVDGVDFSRLDLELEADGSDTVLDIGSEFFNQPEFRYGRLVMSDVGGTSNTNITIPVRTEYWQGSRFITNLEDSGSELATVNSYVCKQTIWQSESTTSDSTLTGSENSSTWETVNFGESSSISATPISSQTDPALREQIRLWMRIGDSAPYGVEASVCLSSLDTPWLQFDWRGKTCGEDNNEECGDEDPSTVVTFGIHRGNDRVIYRGETGLTGQ